MRTVARAAALSASLAPLFKHHGPGEPDRSAPTAGAATTAAATAKVPAGMMFGPGLPAQSPFAGRGDDPAASAAASASAPFAYSYNARTRTPDWVCERLGGGTRRDWDSDSPEGERLRSRGPPGAAPPSSPSTAAVAVASRKRCRFREDGDV